MPIHSNRTRRPGKNITWKIEDYNIKNDAIYVLGSTSAAFLLMKCDSTCSIVGKAFSVDTHMNIFMQLNTNRCPVNKPDLVLSVCSFRSMGSV